MSTAKLTALRCFWLARDKRIEVGETFTCGDEVAGDLISSGKATAVDDATRRRVKMRLISEWADSPDGETHRRYWAAHEQLNALRAGAKD